MSAIATFVRVIEADHRMELFRVDPPMVGTRHDPETGAVIETPYAYVVASASRVAVIERAETYLFGADATGEVLDWLELPGSQHGTLEIDLVLAEAGYRVVRPRATGDEEARS